MFASIGYYICWPFAWLTRMFYQLTGSYGLAILLFTVIVKLILLPFQMKSKKSMLRMNRLQGQVKDIQTRYANNKQKQQEEMAELYAREGVNPMSGCLWSFIPFPIIIALYYIIRTPLRYFMSMKEDVIDAVRELAVTLGYAVPESGQAAAYEQIQLAKFAHEHWADFDGKFKGLIDLDFDFLGIDLAEIPRNLFSAFPKGGWPMWGLFLLPVIATAIQLAMTMVTMKTNGQQNMQGSGKTMMYMMPLMTLWMGFVLPGALSIYWAAQAAFSVVQEKVLNKYFGKILDQEETEKEKAAREKRMEKFQKQKEMMAQQQAQGKGKTKPQQPAKKKTSGEKRESTNENGRVGQRPYARGRAYSEDHYKE